MISLKSVRSSPDVISPVILPMKSSILINSSSFPFTGDTGNSNDYLITHQHEIGEDFQPLPEFVGSGGGVRMFKVPTRSPLHSARPPCLELRPHPLKETQVGRFLRNIACTNTQLWAGQESGVRFWKFDDAFEPGCGLSDRVQRGDEDAAPFHESASTSPTTCLMVDNGNRLVWSGHKDGKIRSWNMDYVAFKEGLCWQAHKGPVNSIIMSSYGNSSQSSFIFVPLSVLVQMQTEDMAKEVISTVTQFPFMVAGMPRPVRASAAELEMFDNRPKKPGRKIRCRWMERNDPDFDRAKKMKRLVRKHSTETSFMLKKQLEEAEKLSKQQAETVITHHKKYEMMDKLLYDGVAQKLADRYNMRSFPHR